MTNQNSLQSLELLKKNTTEYSVEPFVLDFLEFWQAIHEKAKGSSLEDIKDILKDVETSYTLPFYEKYKEEEYLEFVKGWFKRYLSFVLKWRMRGGYLFPLKLIVYEICNYKKQSLELFVKQILSKQIKGEKEALFEYLVPKVTNFVIPLDEMDIVLLKANQIKNRPIYKEISKAELATQLGISTKTVSRRMGMIGLLQMLQQINFVDMARLGYETTLLIHSNSFPEEYKQYLLLSTDLTVGKFSIVHIPYKKPRVINGLQDHLELLSHQQMTHRVSSWNLSQLVSGVERWRDPAPFVKIDSEVFTIQPSPDVGFSLIPPDKFFRPLTLADIKIIDFLSTKGTPESITQLGQVVNVSRPEVSKRLQEYSEEKLLVNTSQYFNVALDSSVFFFISTEDTETPWINNLLTFPKVDVFFQEDQVPYYYFGHLKLPNKWFKPFGRQIDMITQDPGVKFYYKISSAKDFVRWGISLAETYA